MGAVFPGNNSISDIILLCAGKIRSRITGGEWETSKDETCTVSRLDFDDILRSVKSDYGAGFPKKYRDMPDGEFTRNVIEEMERWMFIRQEDSGRQIKLCPLAGKIQGSYPEDFTGDMKDEQQMAGK